MRSQPEYALQCAVADYLRVTLGPEVLWFHVPNGEHRSKITGARLKRMGVRPGVADIMITWRAGFALNRVLWLELKARRGRPSPEQIRFSHDCAAAGHWYRIASSLEDVELALTDSEVPMRGKIAA